MSFHLNTGNMQAMQPTMIDLQYFQQQQQQQQQQQTPTSMQSPYTMSSPGSTFSSPLQQTSSTLSLQNFNQTHVQQQQQSSPSNKILTLRNPSLRLGIPTIPMQSMSSASSSSPSTFSQYSNSSSLRTPSSAYSVDTPTSLIPCPFGPPIQLRADGKRKRVHANKEQLSLLEAAFQANPKPNTRTRVEICKRVGINSRSVQIWFQNRRAREKKLGGGNATGAGADRRTSLGSQASFHSSNGSISPDGNDFFGNGDYDDKMHLTPLVLRRRISMPNLFSGPNGSSLLDLANTIPTDIYRIQTTSLVIGAWRRISIVPEDLVCTLNPIESLLCWTVVESSFSFKMEMPFSSLLDATIDIDPLDSSTATLIIDFSMTPTFAKEVRVVSEGSTQTPATALYIPCDDFTESAQASTVLRHILTGPSQSMEHTFSILTAIAQSFQNQYQQLSAASMPTPNPATMLMSPATTITQSPYHQFPLSSASSLASPFDAFNMNTMASPRRTSAPSTFPFHNTSALSMSPITPITQTQQQHQFRPPFPMIKTSGFSQSRQRSYSANHLDDIMENSTPLTAATTSFNQVPFTPLSINNQQQQETPLTPVTLMALSLSTPTFNGATGTGAPFAGDSGFWNASTVDNTTATATTGATTTTSSTPAFVAESSVDAGSSTVENAVADVKEEEASGQASSGQQAA
ncbi:hypothetical protein HDU76_005018 [Blyttiomyces sp. JEL0837]|nr:hypothetical protein HDU76_005018 [Blyttiomyces sp. JEL0837]